MIYNDCYFKETKMPPKIRITKDDILNKAVEIVRREGYASVNARGLAKEIGCSTQPIFSNYETMDALNKDIIARAVSVYDSFVKSTLESGEYPPYKAHGMGYIKFAKDERELFKLLFMRDRDGRTGEDIPIDGVISLLMQSLGLTKEKAERFHVENWIFVHGIAVMLASGYLDIDEPLISDMITDAYHGLKHSFEVEK